MSRAMRRLLPCLLLASGSLLAGAVPAGADDALPEGARRRAEDAFALGLLDAVEVSLRDGRRDADLEPLRVRDAWWRPSSRATTPVPKELDSLAGRRLVWLRAGGKGPYPAAAAGEADPYPLLTALVLDRQRRETKGSTRLVEETPLAPLAARSDPARYFLESVLPGALRGSPPDLDDLEKARRTETRALATRNQALAAAGLGALGAVAAILFLFARPRARRGAAPGGGDAGRGPPSP